MTQPTRLAVLVTMPMTPTQERIYRLLSSGIAYTDADAARGLGMLLSEYRKEREELSRRRVLVCVRQRTYSNQIQAPKFQAVCAEWIKEAA